MTDQGSLRFPYVLFDLGSTLIHFEGDWPTVITAAIQAATRFLRSKGYDLDEEIFPQAYYDLTMTYYQKRSDQFIEYTATQVLEEALRTHTRKQPGSDDINQALKAFYAVSQAHWHTEEDAVPTLEQLRTRGHRMGIISNASDDHDVQTLVDQSRLRDYFDFILTSACAGYRKPSPRIFKQALAHWGAAPEQAVMIGDTVSADVAGANRMGIASVWISRRADTVENRAAVLEYPPGATIETLAELPRLLAAWIA